MSYPYISAPANRATVSQSLKIQNTQGDMNLLARTLCLASFRCPWRRSTCNKSRSHNSNNNNINAGDDKYINSQPLPAKRLTRRHYMSDFWLRLQKPTPKQGEGPKLRGLRSRTHTAKKIWEKLRSRKNVINIYSYINIEVNTDYVCIKIFNKNGKS